MADGASTSTPGEKHEDEGEPSTADNSQLAPPWQNVFSTASLDNGRLTLQISHVEDENKFQQQHQFRMPKAFTALKPNLKRKPTRSAFHDVATPKLCVVIQIVGSRGDVQPYVALGKALQKHPYNHRVRLATHPNFKDFVEENGLEFFSIGGDPEQLMDYMVKNPGILPGKESRKANDPSHRRADIAEILQGCWRSCIERGDGMQHHLKKKGIIDPAEIPKPKNSEPFVANAIIANPPSYAHIHCAEKLAIPLQLTFTMPWSPTQAFPHPLANIKATDESKTMTNYASFLIMETLAWQGLGDIFNDFRTKTLGLEPINQLWGSTIIPRLRVPWTYCWSEALIPKPIDWAPHIDISGFYFLELASSFTPSPALQQFLDAGPPPVYIGFGSIVISKPKETMDMILEAIAKVGCRALISKGWGGLQCDNPPPNVLMLDSVPHDWLFPRVSCVVHHGGAGTTAIGIKLGKPTVVVPFFGDQPFWGGMVYRAGAGPKPVSYRKLTSDSLAEGLRTALKPESLEQAKLLGKKVEHEDGVAIGARIFQDSLDIDSMRCDIFPENFAVWKVRGTSTQLCPQATNILITEGIVHRKDLELLRVREWDTSQGPQGPFSGAIAAVVGNATDAGMGIHKFNKAMRERKQLKAGIQLKHTTSSDSTSRLTSDEIVEQYLGAIQDHMLVPEVFSDSRTDGNSQTESGASTKGNSLDLSSPGRPSTDLSSLSAQGRKSTDISSLSESVNQPNGKKKHKWGHHKSKPSQSHGRHSLDSTFADTFRLHITRRGTFPGFKSDIPSSKSSPPSESTVSDDYHEKQGHLHGVAAEAARAANTVMQAGLKTPVELAYNLAAGFHNAPILYFDDKMVRKATKVTGFKSGVKAASEELVYGLFDGITGLVTQPYTQTRDEGWIGLPKGIATGIGGLVLKSSAAAFGIPGYLLKGIANEIRRPAPIATDKQILAIRRFQGLESMKTCTPQRQELVQSRYSDLCAAEAARQKAAAASSSCPKRRNRSLPMRTLPDHKDHKDLEKTLEGATEGELETAVQEAVRLTSCGDEEVDQRIAAAVAASLRELQERARAWNVGDETVNGGQVEHGATEGKGKGKETLGKLNEGEEGDGENEGSEELEATERAGKREDEEEKDLPIGAVFDKIKDESQTHSLQYEVWKRICEAHMGITPQSEMGIAVAA